MRYTKSRFRTSLGTLPYPRKNRSAKSHKLNIGLRMARLPSALESWLGRRRPRVPPMHYMDKPTPTQLEGVGIGRKTGVAVGSDLTIPDDWRAATARLHELRQRVVVHRYQMELVEPLWPRLGETWVRQAQKLRNRLGSYQDLVVLARYAEPHQPLALAALVRGQPAAGAARRGGAKHRRPAVRRTAESVPPPARSDVGRHGRQPLGSRRAG